MINWSRLLCRRERTVSVAVALMIHGPDPSCVACPSSRSRRRGLCVHFTLGTMIMVAATDIARTCSLPACVFGSGVF